MPMYILQQKYRKEIIMTNDVKMGDMGGFSYKEYNLGKKGQIGAVSGSEELSGAALRNDKKGFVDVSDGLSANELDKIDENKDGFITYKEFQTFCSTKYSNDEITTLWSQLQSRMNVTTGSVSGEGSVSQQYTEQTLDDGRKVRTYFDSSNKPVKKEIISETRTLTKTDTYMYDEDGNQTSRTLTKTHKDRKTGDTTKTEIYKYNASNEKTNYTITNADKSTVEKKYDPATGKLTDRIEKDADGNVIKYINYNPNQDNVSKIIYDTKTNSVTTYDSNNRKSQVDKYSEYNTFDLNESDNGISLWPGDDNFPITYIYEADNTITMSSFDWFSGKLTETNYDANDESKINSVTVKRAVGNNIIRSKQYEYNSNGSIKSITKEENGTTTEYKFSNYTTLNGERVPRKVKIGNQTHSMAYWSDNTISAPAELAGKKLSEI